LTAARKKVFDRLSGSKEQRPAITRKVLAAVLLPW
jgi:hypothetical protein